jgi:hypothetical protein
MCRCWPAFVSDKNACRPVACMVISACSMACRFHGFRISRTARPGLDIRTSKQSQRTTLARPSLLSSGLVSAAPCHRSKLPSSGVGKVNFRTGPVPATRLRLDRTKRRMQVEAPRTLHAHRRGCSSAASSHWPCSIATCHLTPLRSPLDREYAVTAKDPPWSGPPRFS